MHFRASLPAVVPAVPWNKQCRNSAPQSISEGVPLPRAVAAPTVATASKLAEPVTNTVIVTFAEAKG